MRFEKDAIAIRDELDGEAFSIVPNFFSTAEQTLLIDEATSLEPDAMHFEKKEYVVTPKGQLVGPVHYRYAYGESGLVSVHENPELVEYLSKCAGFPVWPTRAAYLFYEPGDRIGLHTDISFCEISVLTELSDVGEPLLVYPDLIEVPASDVKALVEEDETLPGQRSVRCAVERGALTITRGSRLPHCRPPTEHSLRILLMCYSGI